MLEVTFLSSVVLRLIKFFTLTEFQLFLQSETNNGGRAKIWCARVLWEVWNWVVPSPRLMVLLELLSYPFELFPLLFLMVKHWPTIRYFGRKNDFHARQWCIKIKLQEELFLSHVLETYSLVNIQEEPDFIPRILADLGPEILSLTRTNNWICSWHLKEICMLGL